MHITDDKAVERKRIVIDDDFPEILDTVEQCLAPDYEIVGKVPDGLALVECTCRLQPDLLVIDISMPKLDGIDALRQLRSRGVQTPAIILTNHDDEDLAQEALSLNAQGFVLKSHLGSDLCVAVVEVLAGRIFISETLRRKLLKKNDQANPKGGTRLSPHAMEIALDQSGLLIARAETINWQPQRVPGCWIKPLLVEQQRKIATSLVRMDPGTHFPAHRHGGPEEVFLLDGDLVIEGQKMKPGDYCRAETGTIHAESYTESGCLFFLKASQLDEIFE